jgi:flavodoxin I
MSDIGLFFGSSTGNSETIARMIASNFSPVPIDIFDVIQSPANLILKYKKLIFGVPSWNSHPNHDDWKDFLPNISGLSFRNKKIALYGLGDQLTYSENFVDEMGTLYDWLIERNAEIIGFWPTEGYRFRRSLALRNGKFVGLAIDEDQQSELTSSRVFEWVKNLKQEFNI